MQLIEAFKPFEIQEIKLGQWQRRPVKNNFFELVLIKEGEGTQCINYNEYAYAAGSIFLLPPLQCHSFQIDLPSSFIFLRFTSDFFRRARPNGVNQEAWFGEAAYILANYNQLPGDIIHNELDRQHIRTLIGLIQMENGNHRWESTGLIKSLMTSILEILLRNIKQSAFSTLNPATSTDDRIIRMLSYINENIANPPLLKVEQLAKTFHLSPTYLSEYFRKQVKVPLRQYIIKAKLKLVEIRLLNSSYSLSEIAEELGFTDASHLSKTFKKYTGISVREFRRQGEYRILKRKACSVPTQK